MRLNLPLAHYQMMDCTNKVTLNALQVCFGVSKFYFMAYLQNSGHAKSIFRIHFCVALGQHNAFHSHNYLLVEIFSFKCKNSGLIL